MLQCHAKLARSTLLRAVLSERRAYIVTWTYLFPHSVPWQVNEEALLAEVTALVHSCGMAKLIESGWPLFSLLALLRAGGVPCLAQQRFESGPIGFSMRSNGALCLFVILPMFVMRTILSCSV